MHIKIYFNEKPLFLTDKITSEIEPFAHHDDAVFIDELSHGAINSMLHEMRQEKVHAGIYYHTDLEALKKEFFKKFKIMPAAGGLTVNEDGNILFIFRRGTWDLPKGRLEDGESIETCAVREVEEETGLTNVQLKKHLINTYHTYEERGHLVLKESWWYLLEGSKDQTLVPQKKEQITEAEWGTPGKLDKYLSNTYPNIIDVVRAAGY